MKKAIPTIGLISLLLIVTATGITFSDKQEALNYFHDYKQDRESALADAVSSITYTSDEICKINYYTERIMCQVCFELDLLIANETKRLSKCVNFKEGLTESGIDARIQESVQLLLQKHYPIEEVNYVAKHLKDKKILLDE